MVYECQPDERAMPISQFGTLFTNFGSVVNVGIDHWLFCRSTVGSFTDQPSETNTDDEPWNGEKETMLLCHVKQCDVFSFSLRNI
jgi:hypothetical protein